MGQVFCAVPPPKDLHLIVRENKTLFFWIYVIPAMFSPLHVKTSVFFWLFNTLCQSNSLAKAITLTAGKCETIAMLSLGVLMTVFCNKIENAAYVEITWWFPGFFAHAPALWPPYQANIVTIGGNLIKNASGIVAQPLSNNGSDRHHLGIVLQQCVKDKLGGGGVGGIRGLRDVR